VVFFIRDYLAKEQQAEGKDYSHHCKFILEYSSQNHALIAAFLSSAILPHSYILHYNDRGEDIAEIAARLMEERTPAGGSINHDMEAAVKVALRILDELHAF
jgi:hypothetical protein